MKTQQRPKHSVFRTAFCGGIFVALLSAAGYYASLYVAGAIMAGLMKYAIGVIGIVWLFSLNVYNKLTDVTDMAGIDYKQHRSLEIEVQSRLQWFWVRGFFLAFVALAMYLPSIFFEAKLPIPSWVFGLSGGAFALAIFSLRRLLSEMEEIRELRSHVKELERREQARSEIVKALKDDAKTEWVPDGKLDGFRGDSPPPR
jgi:hypothetical protein